MSKYSSFLLAGSRPKPDVLCEHYGVKYKALIPVAGSQMITYSLNALLVMEDVKSVTVLLQEPDYLKSRLEALKGNFNDKLSFRESTSTIAATIINVINSESEQLPALITTADNCLLGPSDIEEFIEKSKMSDADIVIGFVEKNALLSKYPDAQRTWLRFEDVSVTGCNLFAIKNKSGKQAVEFWSVLEKDRKKVLKMALHFGPLFFLKYWLGFMKISDFFAAISQRLGCRIEAVYMSNPDIAQDADKLVDIQIIESVLN